MGKHQGVSKIQFSMQRIAAKRLLAKLRFSKIPISKGRIASYRHSKGYQVFFKFILGGESLPKMQSIH
ncbi:hypothetical protein NTGM5_140029 [Candidatus Nitrotoga sp. M5]|nr:hypothetical protein NTGM5_140029 [Candidatus Nitrotoga sp. M5]